ncbi:hypothetical protein L226DRAFT_560637 [Lentinus tigrinus ALCF2SS1-7]|uniref:WIBG Mago-binding domain-containing protein n=1 Tax=Lentinus tigrinus ALCF2SS1-6 TaxID=1328759 RepID=A0A5C2SFA1_9APHY|nr:hypothetical protein L227DRAFT_652101 [Lentinus tigrinus ALCF2SS1-6]RPD74434.1 hypothetical protein L226DRAFT_560637 [Lentinus tigrinus ALCF2SS1-7]
MSKPAIVPETSAAGIAVDPRTLERVIPESRRPDGTVRKQIKIRPGFTPQEDVRRFRGTRQAQMDASALPKGHIIGWAPPPQAATPPASKAGMSKAQKKNEKRKEKRKEKKEETEKVKDSWEDEDEGEVVEGKGTGTTSSEREDLHTADKPNWAVASESKDASADALADKLDKLEVR